MFVCTCLSSKVNLAKKNGDEAVSGKGLPAIPALRRAEGSQGPGTCLDTVSCTGKGTVTVFDSLQPSSSISGHLNSIFSWFTDCVAGWSLERSSHGV